MKRLVIITQVFKASASNVNPTYASLASNTTKSLTCATCVSYRNVNI